MARNRAAHPTNPARRRFAAVVLGVVGIAGLGIASAAQITVGSSTLGVGATIVSTCQGAGTITTSFPTAWNTTAPAAYRVTAVTLSGVNPACVGKAYRIQMLNGSGVAVGPEIVSAVPALGGGGTFTTAAIAAASQPLGLDVAGVSIVISG